MQFILVYYKPYGQEKLWLVDLLQSCKHISYHQLSSRQMCDCSANQYQEQDLSDWDTRISPDQNNEKTFVTLNMPFHTR